MIDKARNWKSSLNLQRRAEIYILVTAHIFLFSPLVLCSYGALLHNHFPGTQSEITWTIAVINRAVTNSCALRVCTCEPQSEGPQMCRDEHVR